MTASLRINNRRARALFIDAQGFCTLSSGVMDLGQTIRDLGFVQLDTVQVVARAHHHILWSRHQQYREPMLDCYMTEQRGVFEHFTHDASVIPMAFYPMWTRQFRRLEARLRKRGWHVDEADAGQHASVRQRIEAEGPLSTKDFERVAAGNKGVWSLPPHKRALEYLWYSGELATSHRQNFVKYYDLAERVIPKDIRAQSVSDQKQVDWLCRAALQRMVFGTPGDIQRFWDALDSAEVSAWCTAHAKDLVPVEIQSADGAWRKSLALENIESRLQTTPQSGRRLRILNPFDPAIRDRARLKRLFGFDYRVEMFVPAAKRRWGYYVYPLLERDRFVGRIEVRANRSAGTLSVQHVWHEPGVKWSKTREARLQAELRRLARLVGVGNVIREQ